MSPLSRTRQTNSITLDGHRVRELRTRIGLSQPDVAALSGLSTGTIGNIEGGKRPTLTVNPACRLAAALGVRLEVIICPAPMPEVSAQSEAQIQLRLLMSRVAKLESENQRLRDNAADHVLGQVA